MTPAKARIFVDAERGGGVPHRAGLQHAVAVGQPLAAVPQVAGEGYGYAAGGRRSRREVGGEITRMAGVLKPAGAFASMTGPAWAFF